MYQVIINKNQGFTESKKEFNNIKEACNFAQNFDNIIILKNNKVIFKERF